MTNSNNPQDRTQLRHTLLANGFEPLPLDGKACYVSGWSHVAIDAEFIDGFRRNGRFSNTGIRCGNVVGVDIDCDDEELAGLVDDCISDLLGVSTWCRWGRGSRRLLLYWTDEPLAKLRTRRFGGQQVEVLGKGCQFAAYGLHPTTGQEYVWECAEDIPGCEPARNPVDELPAVTAAQLRDLVVRLDALLEATGLLVEGAARLKGDTDSDFVLTDESVFDVRDRGPMTVAQLKAESADGWVCNLTAIRPDSDSWGGLIRRTHDGGVCVADFVSGTVYYEAREAVDDAPADVAGMAALMGAIATAAQAGGGLFALPVPTPLADLLANYCYVAVDDTVRRLDAPSFGIKRANFANLHRSYVQTGPRSKQLLVPYWLENGAIRCTRAALLPAEGARVVPMDGGLVLNTYVAPVFPLEGGGVETFHDFVGGLIPDAGERDLLLDWMAFKVQHPEARMHALVLVAQEMGTGRGTLMKIMERLIGSAYTTHTTLAHVFGRTYQSQYNDWLADSLLITVPEAVDGTDGGHDWQSRRRAYEALKEVVETSSGRQMMRRKGAPNSNVELYCSMVVSTNHIDALAVSRGDRRLLVLSGGVVRTPAFYVRLNAWMAQDANIGALRRELLARQVAYDPYGPPPMTDGKALMLDASVSDMDYAFELACEQMLGDLCTIPQLVAFMHKAAEENDLTLPPQLAKVLGGFLTHNAFKVDPKNGRWQVRVGKARVRPWGLRNRGKWQQRRMVTDPWEVAAEILKNGAPGGAILRIDGKPWESE